MIDLESTRWRELRHACGPASDLPALLGRLARGERSADLQQVLYGKLWHQGDVFTASYAAVPYIIEAAAKMQGDERLQWLVLAVGIIATGSTSRAPSVPDDLGAGLEQATKDAQGLVLDTLFTRSWKPYEVPYLLGIIAALQGMPDAGLALFDLDAGVTCGSCGSEIDLARLLHFTA